MMYTILLIEDDIDIRSIIKTYFKKRDIVIIEAIDGFDGLSKLNNSTDLILLDIMMPGIDGYEVCYQIRQSSQCPIVFMSALSEEENQLKAFQYGGDDYISKPFLPFGKLNIDYLNHQVWLENEELSLTHKEYLLLEYLTKNAYQLLSREQILDALWGYDYYGDARAVDTYIKKVRKKLGKYQGYIQTVFKVGYVFKGGEDCET